MGKKYKTINGYEAMILATDLPGDRPVAASVIYCTTDYDLHRLTADLKLELYDKEPFLVEVGPWDDFKIDDKVLVSILGYGPWVKRYFAGVSSDGLPMTFRDGATSWSANGKPVPWDCCKKADDAGD